MVSDILCLIPQVRIWNPHLYIRIQHLHAPIQHPHFKISNSCIPIPGPHPGSPIPISYIQCLPLRLLCRGSLTPHNRIHIRESSLTIPQYCILYPLSQYTIMHFESPFSTLELYMSQYHAYVTENIKKNRKNILAILGQITIDVCTERQRFLHTHMPETEIIL